MNGRLLMVKQSTSTTTVQRDRLVDRHGVTSTNNNNGTIVGPFFVAANNQQKDIASAHKEVKL
jgi:hypothetical protein